MRTPPPAPAGTRRPGRALLADASLVAGLLALLVLVSASAPRWSRFLRQPLQSSPEDAAVDDPPASPTPAPAAGDVQRTINVKLFFAAQDGSGLVIEDRTVPFSADLARQIETVVTELVAGSREGHLAPLAPETRVLGAFLTGGGVAYVNLSKEAQGGLPGGSHAELLSVYALVDSIAANFPAVRRVQVLVEDKPAETLAGHVDLSRPLPSDMSLLALVAMAPAGEPGASPSPAAPGGEAR